MNITYQSKLELDFIKKCNKRGIVIENGPRIPYIWEDKERNYIVDYYVPKLNLLIELKDNHIWHKQQLENGKWDAKMEAVQNMIENNVYKDFIMIMKDNVVAKMESLEKMYLNNELSKI